MTARDLYNKMLSEDSTCTTIEMMEAFAKLSVRFKPLVWVNESSHTSIGNIRIVKKTNNVYLVHENHPDPQIWEEIYGDESVVKQYVQRLHEENILQHIEP